MDNITDDDEYISEDDEIEVLEAIIECNAMVAKVHSKLMEPINNGTNKINYNFDEVYYSTSFIIGATGEQWQSFCDGLFSVDAEELSLAGVVFNDGKDDPYTSDLRKSRRSQLLQVVGTLTNLTRFSLENNNLDLNAIWSDLCVALVKLDLLEELDLSGNASAPDANYTCYTDLGKCLNINLKKISFACTPGPNEIAKVLKQLNLKSLTHLEWFRNLPRVSENEMQLDKDFVQCYKNTISIIFDDNANDYSNNLKSNKDSLTAVEWQRFCEFLRQFENLEILDFQSVGVDEQGTIELASLIKSPGCKITECLCDRYDIIDDAFKKRELALPNNKLLLLPAYTTSSINSNLNSEEEYAPIKHMKITKKGFNPQ